MSVSVQGRDNAIAQVWADGEVEAVYVGEEQVWPDMSGEGGILIEAPADVSAAAVSWKLAIDAADNFKADENQYTKFTVDGVDYYINSAPNGAERVMLEGNVLRLTKKQKAALVGKLGNELEILIKYPERRTGWQNFQVSDDTTARFEATWYMPLMAGMMFVVSGYKSATSQFTASSAARIIMETLTCKPSGTILDIDTDTLKGQGKYKFEVKSRALKAAEVNTTDTSFTLKYNVKGAVENVKGIAPIWPALETRVKVKVISLF